MAAKTRADLLKRLDPYWKMKAASDRARGKSPSGPASEGHARQRGEPLAGYPLRRYVVSYVDPSLLSHREASRVQRFGLQQRGRGDCWTCHRFLSPAPAIGFLRAIMPEPMSDSEADLMTLIRTRLSERPHLLVLD